MKKYGWVICLAVICFSSFGDTIVEVTGTPITGIWKKDNSPYVIKQSSYYQNIIKNLIIEPGVIIRCNSLNIDKCDSLIACGTPGDPIIFETENGGTFGTLSFSYAKFIHLKNVQFKNNLTGLKFVSDTMVHLENMELPITSQIDIQNTINTVFDSISIKTSKSTLCPSKSPLQLHGCDFQNVIFNILQSPLEISNSRITNNARGSFFEYIGESTPIVLKDNYITNCKSSYSFKILRANYFTMSGCNYGNNNIGIEIQQCDAVRIQGNTIRNNAASFRIFDTKHIILSGNEISYNKSPGVRFLNNTGTAVISNNLIANNIAWDLNSDDRQNGAGICSSSRDIPDNDSLILTGNIIVNNYAFRYGGAVCLNANYIELGNNTIVNNFSKVGSCIILSSLGSIYNTIIYGNRSEKSDKQITFFRNSAKGSFVKNCLIQNGLNGIDYCDSIMGYDTLSDTNNIVHSYNGLSDLIVNENPDFINPSPLADTSCDGTAYDWRLSQVSPCVDHGSNSYYDYTFSPTDYWGNNRILNSTIDIGAHEYCIPVKLKQSAIRNKPFLINGYKNFDLLGRNITKPLGSSKIMISRAQERYAKNVSSNVRASLKN